MTEAEARAVIRKGLATGTLLRKSTGGDVLVITHADGVQSRLTEAQVAHIAKREGGIDGAERFLREYAARPTRASKRHSMRDGTGKFTTHENVSRGRWRHGGAVHPALGS
jgi:hypothetical protein